MIQQFDHRFANADKPSTATGKRGRAEHLGAEQKSDPSCFATTRYLVRYHDVAERAKGHRWFIGYREVAGVVANIRTMAATIVPFVGAGHKIQLIASDDPRLGKFSHCLVANLNSFVYDYIVRQKMTGISLSFFIVKQI